MDTKTGICKKCKCSYSCHVNTSYIIKEEKVEEIVVIENKKKRFDDAVERLTKTNAILNQKFNKKDSIINDLEIKFKNIQNCAQLIKQYALRTTPYCSTDHYKEL